MKNWEDIIKDKLEGYESPLPEGSLAEFHSRRDSARSAAAKKRSPLIWILPTAAAAGLAVFLFLRQPGTPEGDGQNGWQPSTTIAVANTDSTNATEPIQPVQSAQSAQPVQTLQPTQPAQLIAQATTPKAVLPASGDTQKTDAVEDVQQQEESQQATEPTKSDGAIAGAAPDGTEEAAGPGQDGQTVSPSQDEQTVSPSQDGQAGQQPNSGNTFDTRTATTINFPTVELDKTLKKASYNSKALATAGGAVGAGLLTTLLTSVDFGRLTAAPQPEGVADMRDAVASYLITLKFFEQMGIDTSDPAVLEYLFNNPLTGSWSPQKSLIEKLIELGVDPNDAVFLEFTEYMAAKNNYETPTKPSSDPTPQISNLLKTAHHMPLKAGLSVRTPVSDKLYLTTGLDYSRYASVYTYSQSGEIKEFERYLGIPLRLDWVFASSKMFDLYAGAGVQAEWCLAGSEGFSTSLLGASGIQFNLTDWLGVYVEPQLSWKMTLDKPTATTYRSEHPLMFAVATGIRLTID